MHESERTEIVYRPFALADRAFIESSWASSYYSACRIKDILSPADFHAFHRPLRERFFSRPNATVIVASPADDPNFILGWLAVEVLPNCAVLHYLYVKSSFRREYGIAKELIARALPPGDVIYTHLSPKASEILRAHPALFARFRFCPHLT